MYSLVGITILENPLNLNLPWRRYFYPETVHFLSKMSAREKLRLATFLWQLPFFASALNSKVATGVSDVFPNVFHFTCVSQPERQLLGTDPVWSRIHDLFSLDQIECLIFIFNWCFADEKQKISEIKQKISRMFSQKINRRDLNFYLRT